MSEHQSLEHEKYVKVTQSQCVLKEYEYSDKDTYYPRFEIHTF